MWKDLISYAVPFSILSPAFPQIGTLNVGMMTMYEGWLPASKLCDLMKACVSGGRQNECGKWQQFQGPCQQVRNLTKDSKGEMLMIFLSERRCLCQVAQKAFSWKGRKTWHPFCPLRKKWVKQIKNLKNLLDFSQNREEIMMLMLSLWQSICRPFPPSSSPPFMKFLPVSFLS